LLSARKLFAQIGAAPDLESQSAPVNEKIIARRTALARCNFLASAHGDTIFLSFTMGGQVTGKSLSAIG
jgi:hypothetical protein